MIKKTEDKNSRGKGEPANFPEDTSFESVAAYERARVNNPWNVQGMQPDKHYFFASTEGGYSPQNVAALKRLGYVVSELKHENPDLILMECPKEIYKYRQMQNAIQDQVNRLQSLEPTGIPEVSQHGGGIYKLPTHGLSKPR